MSETVNEDLVKRAEAARIAGVDPITVWKWGKERRIRRAKVGGTYRYFRSELEQMREAEATD